MSGTSPRSVFPGSGLIHEIGQALGRADRPPTIHELQQIVTDPSVRDGVVAVLHREIGVQVISSQAWAERELAIGAELEKLGLAAYDQQRVESAWREGVGIHHHFLPGGRRRRQLLEACGRAGIKLSGGNSQSADCDGQELPTVAGVFELNYADIMVPTDADHRPFMRTYDQQWSWACELGGDGFTSVEEALQAAVLCPWIVLGRMPFMGGGIRCRNSYGSDDSLYVNWYAGDGLSVSAWSRRDQDWSIGAVPRKYLALGT